MTKKEILIVFILAFLLTIVGFVLRDKFFHPPERFNLTVRVVHLLDESSVTGATVEVVSSNNNVVTHQSLDNEGLASLQLPSGRYLVRMASGYTGQAEIDLYEDLKLDLKVIPVVR